MKKVALVIAMGLLSFGDSFASNTPDLYKEINQKITVDLSTVELDKYVPDFVLVSFKIVNGEIKIDEVSSSKIELKKIMVKKLVQMKIESAYKDDVTYRYRFTFQKM